MRVIIEVNLDISDEYIEKWSKDRLKYNTSLYHSEEKAEKEIKENPIQNSYANEIEDLLMNYSEGLNECTAKVMKVL